MCRWPLFVCPSVCPMPDTKLRMEGLSKLKIVRKKAHDTGDPWPHLEIEQSKVNVTRPINAVTADQPYLWNGMVYELRTCYMDRVQWPASLMCGDLQPESCGWMFKSPHAGGKGVLWWPQYRPHSLFQEHLAYFLSITVRCYSQVWLTGMPDVLFC